MKKYNRFLNEYRMPDDIFKAIKTKNFEKIKKYKDQVNDLSHLGYSTLYFSFIYGNMVITKLLLELGADPNKINGEGNNKNRNMSSTFKSAIEKNNAKLLKLLISYGLDIHQTVINVTYKYYQNYDYDTIYTDMTSLDYAIIHKAHIATKFLYQNNIKITNPMEKLINIFSKIKYEWDYEYKTNNPIVILLTNDLSDYNFFIKNIKLSDTIIKIIEQLPEKNEFIQNIKRLANKHKKRKAFNI